MKNVITLIIITLVIASCGTKKEMVEETPTVETPTVEKVRPKPQTRDRKAKPRVDLDLLIAQLGLSEAQEEEFSLMWNNTADAMMLAREEEDRNALRTKMKAVRDERQAGVKSILTPAQLTKYYKIMDENRKKMGGAPIKRGG